MDQRLAARRKTARRWAVVVAFVWFACGVVGAVAANMANGGRGAPNWFAVAMLVGVYAAPVVYAVAWRVLLGRDRAAVIGAVRAERDNVSRQQEEDRQARERRAEEALKAQADQRLAYERAAKLPGTPEWQRRRRAERVRQVLSETGVRWRPELYSAARTSSERRARSRMRELEAADRREATRAKQAETDRRLRRGHVQSARAAELAMARWMRTQYFENVTVCDPGTDGGIDIRADGAVAQVKFWRSKPVGRPTVQQLCGAAAGARSVLFAFEGGGFTPQAIAWAEDHDVALFVYNEHGAVVGELTTEARRISAAAWMQRGG